MEPEGLGLAIRRRRTALGLTLNDAAERAGMNAGALGPIERYFVHRIPRRLHDIARALDTTSDALLAESRPATGG